MKKIGLCLVGLILALASMQMVETSFNGSSYDLMADVNRDSIVDANDLSRLGKAYGSSLVLPSISNKTVVTVLSFDKEPPEVENARVAIIDPEVYRAAVDVNHTSSLGIVTFELSPNKNFIAIAWSGSAYNYANFTTDSLGEASVLILLGEPSLSPIRSLPQGWIVVTAQNNETGSIVFDVEFIVKVYCIEYQPHVGFVSTGSGRGIIDETTPYLGVVVMPPDWLLNEPHSAWGVLHAYTPTGEIGGYGVYSPDENGCANVVLYVTPP